MVDHTGFHLSALLLAGGQGSRVDGRDKGLIAWQGRPVAEHLAILLRQVSAELIISCNRNHEQYRKWADVLVSDPQPDFPGPLAGILSGLKACSGTHLLVLPCDVPKMNAALLCELIALAQAQPNEPCITRTGDRWQPLVSIVPVALTAELQAAWEEGVRSPMRWLAARSHQVFHLPEADQRFFNANQLKDWNG
ncbi:MULTISPECIES: molybdenum cofactor guanylyltransferase MobA [Pseudomonas]|uniref:molybdenum cofactor guanylyltransferase MobA n=1 Tax=Pseudomonas TaxID=286 RepID=UPI00123C1C68|nr:MULTISPECIES: molybdenum cofactor guanylyltransferase MobA [Pseudomonas]QIB51713.1 molybdenum cofactor guanylyltransferase MobA [Pseudomonas sp. OIL-1]